LPRDQSVGASSRIGEGGAELKGGRQSFPRQRKRRSIGGGDWLSDLPKID